MSAPFELVGEPRPENAAASPGSSWPLPHWHFEDLRVQLLRLAEDRLATEGAAVERARRALDRWDAESERLIAEAGERVKTVGDHVRSLESRGGGNAGEELTRLRRELQVAKQDASDLVYVRLDHRGRNEEQFSNAARRMLEAGEQVFRLAGFPSLARMS